MKKTKLFLLAAMVVAIGSAFTTVKAVKLDVAYGYYDSQWIAVDPAREGEDFLCNTGTTYCLYEDQSFDHPIGAESKSFDLPPTK